MYACLMLLLLCSNFIFCQTKMSTKLTLDNALALVQLLDSKGQQLPKEFMDFKINLVQQLDEALNKQCTSCYRVCCSFFFVKKFCFIIISLGLVENLAMYVCKYKRL